MSSHLYLKAIDWKTFEAAFGKGLEQISAEVKQALDDDSAEVFAQELVVPFQKAAKKNAGIRGAWN